MASDTTNLQIVLKTQGAHQIQLSKAATHSIGILAPVAHQGAKVTIKTAEEWALLIDYIPKKGELVIYSDRNIVNGVAYAGVKIGDGLAYVVDLPFLGDEIAGDIIQVVQNHIDNPDIHVTAAEKAVWNDKLNYEINEREEELILNRL